MAGDAPPPVEFELELADYRALLRYGRARHSTGSVARLLVVFAVAFYGTVCISFLRRNVSAFVAGLFVSILLMVYSALRALRRVQPQPQGALLCRYRVQLDDAGVHVETPLWSSHFSWTGILAVDETAAHCFLRFDTASAYVIPKRAFADAGAVGQFTSFARERAAGSRRASE